jgi:chromosome segregation ATPase
MEEELTKMTQLYNDIQQAMEDYKTREEKSVKLNKEYAISIKEKVSVIERKDEIIQEHEDIIKQREDDLQQLLDQISQRDSSIRELRDSLRNRDERLKEKDEILQNMNLGTDEKQEEINYLTSEMSDSESQIKEKDEKIKNLEEKVEKYEKKNKDSNVQIENDRLNRELEDMAFSIGKVHTDNNTLQVEMEKTKQALSEAMVLWNKDRSTLGQELTVAREKVAMFEACLDKKENQAAQLLRKEAHKYLEQKEKLQHELRVSKVEHDANMRTLKIEKQKLQDELTQTIRQLTSEMSNNDKMSADLERLKCQVTTC